ncbi:Cystathionine beta-lyase [Pseudozyma hubeiensis]|nr:Cystathionine beta-lyase [Pseudozyma hubeiensis]
MEYDPVNRDVPAPRYELESGSEDEFEHGTGQPQEPYQLVGGTLEPGSQLVVLIGNAGIAALSSLGTAPTQQLSLQSGSEQHAAVGVATSSSGTRVTAALVAPPPQLRSFRFHEIAQTIIEASKPSSIVIVDSYSPQEQIYRDPESEEEAGWEAAIRYLATPSYAADHTIDSKRLTPLRSPESASGLGAAFLSKAVIDDIPAILTLLEDVSFQSHIQLYGSLGASRLSPTVSETLSTLTGLGGSNTNVQTEAGSTGSTLLDFAASRRVKPAANLAVLGDGNMYI